MFSREPRAGLDNGGRSGYKKIKLIPGGVFMRDFYRDTDPIQFVFPIDGDFLNIYDGTEDKAGLHITVRLKAPFEAELTVNEVPCTFDRETGEYSATVCLDHFRNTLAAVDRRYGYRSEIRVYRGYDPTKKVWFTVDDAIVFLYDLAMNPEKYPSMFDHPFLNTFRTAHELYGTAVNLHLYYCYDEASARDFAEHKQYFDLSMMPDRWKKEWEANADWLTLSYHAHSNYPDAPFKVYPREFVDKSIRMVHSEIRRFAGEASLSNYTVLHFGNGYIENLRAFRENGYRLLGASFRVLDDSEPYMGFYGRDGLPAHIRGEGQDAYDRNNQTAAITQKDAGSGQDVHLVTCRRGETGRDFWHDHQEDITYVRTDMVLNVIDQKDIESFADEHFKVPQRCGFFTPMIHEEYFYPDYVAYIPDCRERVLTACKYAFDHGYTGIHPRWVALER